MCQNVATIYGKRKSGKAIAFDKQFSSTVNMSEKKFGRFFRILFLKWSTDFMMDDGVMTLPLITIHL